MAHNNVGFFNVFSSPPYIKGSIMGERAMIRSFVSAYLKCYMRELGSHHSKKSTFFSNSKAKSIFFVKLSSRHNAFVHMLDGDVWKNT